MLHIEGKDSKIIRKSYRQETVDITGEQAKLRIT